MMAAIVVIIAANAGMNADAANMDSDADIGAGCRCAQHGQRKDRSEKRFHGSQAGCCCEMQWRVPRPHTSSRQSMGTISRPGKHAASTSAAAASRSG